LQDRLNEEGGVVTQDGDGVGRQGGLGHVWVRGSGISRGGYIFITAPARDLTGGSLFHGNVSRFVA
jgi:hypothetical protein